MDSAPLHPSPEAERFGPRATSSGRGADRAGMDGASRARGRGGGRTEQGKWDQAAERKQGGSAPGGAEIQAAHRCWRTPFPPAYLPNQSSHLTPDPWSPRMAEPAEALRDALADRYRIESRARPRRHGNGLPRAGPPPRPPRRPQGAPPRALRHARPRPLPPRDQARRAAPAPAHPGGARLAATRPPAPELLWFTMPFVEGESAARPAEPGAAAPGGGRGPDRARGGGGARLRPPARRHPPRHQAGEHPPPATITRWSPTSASHARSRGDGDERSSSPRRAPSSARRPT